MMEALGGGRQPSFKAKLRPAAGFASTARAPTMNSVRRYLLPRLLSRPSFVLSPVESCFGTSPSQAPKSRPLVKAAPFPIAATTELLMPE
jgi:hypothetical protein